VAHGGRQERDVAAALAALAALVVSRPTFGLRPVEYVERAREVERLIRGAVPEDLAPAPAPVPLTGRSGCFTW